MTMPNFFIIGAQKAGTTSLYHYLEQHPQVFMSQVKEPHFFAFENEKVEHNGPRDQHLMDLMLRNDIESYQSLFSEVGDQIAIGEASVMYLYYSKSAQRIRSRIPDAKLIVILRNPVDRAYSSYTHLRRDGRETLTNFQDALDAEPQRIKDGWNPLWHYQQAGLYYSQLKVYLETFPREQIKIFLYDDLREAPTELLKDLFGFLQIDDSFEVNFTDRYNVSGIPTNKGAFFLYRAASAGHPVKTVIKHLMPRRFRKILVQKTTNGIIKNFFARPPKLSPEVRAMLSRKFEQDIRNVETLIDRDLSAWLQAK